ncbi:MAG: M20 aminoacylase family protein [Pseudomonadota bacterium]
MPIVNRIADFAEDMKAWRRDIHKHPETAFEEERTADIVAEKLAGWGIEVHRGLATTGVVGLLKGNQDANRMIGLRADLDALPMSEFNDFDHRSVHDGKMHACGHDGHTTMLLGAARYLAETRNFAGQVAFIFQPAEEQAGGGRVMVEEGLFEQFPVEGVYGLHNMPGIPAGEVAVRPGPMLAGSLTFEAKITAKGAHAAMPHLGDDVIVLASQVVGAWQTITSRRLSPIDNAVVSVTQFHSGEATNVLPEVAELKGSVRAFKEEVMEQVKAEMKLILEGHCAIHGAACEIDFLDGYPATVNQPRETGIAADAAELVVGAERVDRDATPVMGSEDFAYMLQAKPGCYIFLGNGNESGPSSCTLHNPYYDFNDEILVVGASYWARLVESVLPKAA